MLTCTDNLTSLKALILPVVFMDNFLKDKSSKVISFGVYIGRHIVQIKRKNVEKYPVKVCIPLSY